MVRSHDALANANEDLASLLTVIRSPSTDNDFESLLGIWVDEDGVANLPCALILRDVTGTQRTVRILEAMGINGFWMLCWLEAVANTVNRVDLVAALLECFDHDDTAMNSVRFIPVFSDRSTDSSISAELQLLEARYPGLVQRPIYRNSGGKLILPSSQLQDNGT